MTLGNAEVFRNYALPHRKNGGATAQPIRGDFANPWDSVQSQRSPSLAPLYLCRALPLARAATIAARNSRAFVYFQTTESYKPLKLLKVHVFG